MAKHNLSATLVCIEVLPRSDSRLVTDLSGSKTNLEVRNEEDYANVRQPPVASGAPIQSNITILVSVDVD